MADGYWNRQQPANQMLSSAGMLKRPRTEFDVPPAGLPGNNDMLNYMPRDDDLGGCLVVKDTKTIGSAYDRYLQNSQLSSFTSGEASSFSGFGRASGSGMSARQASDPNVMGPGVPELVPNGRNVGYSGQHPIDAMARPGRETVPLPPDASSTLYVEGLPPDSTRREVAHIFRPFVGYKEVRLVSKESKHRGGDPIILCFVDFADPACAATALSALQEVNSANVNVVELHDGVLMPYLVTPWMNTKQILTTCGFNFHGTLARDLLLEVVEKDD